MDLSPRDKSKAHFIIRKQVVLRMNWEIGVGVAPEFCVQIMPRN